MQKQAQMPGDPMGGGMLPPGGAPPMGGMPPMGGAPPMGGMPPSGPPTLMGGGEDPPILGPLEGVGEILYDFGIDKYIAGNPEEGDSRLALSVWKKYGGNSDGTVDSNKTGRRTNKDSKRNPQEAQPELEETEERRWERLPLGQTIGEITSLYELQSMMEWLVLGALKKFRSPLPGAPPPGGGMPMAAISPRMVKEAELEKIIADALLNPS